MDLWSSADVDVHVSEHGPASRHTRAKLLQLGKLLSGVSLDLLPSVSKGAPHSHRASTTCSGRRSRSNTKVRKSCGQTTNLGPLGAPMSTSLELGPECDANGLGQQQHDWRKTMVSRKWCSEMENAWKPCCHSPGSLFKQRGGRAPPSMWPNWAVPQTTTVEILSCLLQFTQGSDGLLHRKLQLDTVRDFGETSWASRQRSKESRLSHPGCRSQTQTAIRMGKLESVWATLFWIGSPGNPPNKASIVLCMPTLCPVA